MSRPRILIVEDDVVAARFICSQLEALGYAMVGEARVGEEAVAMVAQLRPDLVLMDLQFGSAMDCIAAAQLIRAQHTLPIVFLSVFAVDDLLLRAHLAEPYGYILKPFSERELRTVIEMALYKYQAESRQRDLTLHNQAIQDNIVHGVITLNAHGLIESCNKGVGAIFGYAADELLGRNVAMLVPEPQRNQQASHFQHEQNHQERGLIRELEGQRKDGSVFPIHVTMTPITLAGQPIYVAILTDLSQRRKDEEKIRHLAFYDELTGLPNRRLLMDRLALAIIASARSGQHGALLFLDLDHFRQINESLGPGVGDELLREVGMRLLGSVRESDTVSHFGGDEFMVMIDSLGLHGDDAALQAEALAHKIRLALGRPYSLQNHLHTSTPSVGVVMFGKNRDAVDDLLKMADAAMYQAKAAGRNTVCFFDPAMQALAVERTELEKDLRRGLAQQEFVLHYQIQVDAQGAPTGAEALVRWLHPVRGLVPPGQFIPLAEETGLILELGQWVLESACSQLVQWSGRAETAAWTMSINVSALQFAQDDFVASVARALARHGADPLRIKLELTESMLVGDVQDVIAKMCSIKAQGVSFSLDDFGTGYSSLSYLKRLPIDQLKIDQSFVRELLNDPDYAAISQSIVSLGHNLGLKVIAEGVENPDQRNFLADIGCDAFQGYYFGRPVASAELTQNLM